MKFYIILVLVWVSLVGLVACDNEKQDLTELNNISNNIKEQYAPDKRVAVYDISISSIDNSVVLSGESDQPGAIKELKERLSNKGIVYLDSIVLLPDESVGKYKFAVVNNSVANIRSKAKHSGELATQAILGTGLKVLKLVGDFYLVQTPDAYISWVDHGGVTLMDQKEYLTWLKKPKIIYTKPFGYVYQYVNNDLNKLSDIVLGAQLLFIEDKDDYFKVQFPDKRVGFIKKSEGELYDNWIKELQPSGDLMELYARDFLGAPYLWGGTSTKGMDCSGFTKTVYLMNGFIIPRDASQQINAGKDVDPNLKFENLEKGDLLFFGRKASDSTRQKVTHVGIWLGNNKGEFIHESKQVRISSIDPESVYYDEKNTNRYLGSRRYLGETDKLITNLKTDPVLTEIKD
jgi:gamma-D-glutamyl-L-lysine dipeptidyl-peptidase